MLDIDVLAENTVSIQKQQWNPCIKSDTKPTRQKVLENMSVKNQFLSFYCSGHRPLEMVEGGASESCLVRHPALSKAIPTTTSDEL